MLTKACVMGIRTRDLMLHKTIPTDEPYLANIHYIYEKQAIK